MHRVASQPRRLEGQGVATPPTHHSDLILLHRSQPLGCVRGAQPKRLKEGVAEDDERHAAYLEEGGELADHYPELGGAVDRA